MPGRRVFPRAERLLKPSEYEKVFSGGIRLTRKPVGIVFMPNSRSRPRLGLAVSKKAVPLATQRNRLKRGIREIFRASANELPAVDIVVYMQPGATSIENPELRKILQLLWVKLNQRCASS